MYPSHLLDVKDMELYPFTAEKISDHRERDGVVEFMVQFAGVDFSWNQWMVEDEINDDLLDEYGSFVVVGLHVLTKKSRVCSYKALHMPASSNKGTANGRRNSGKSDSRSTWQNRFKQVNLRIITSHSSS